MQVRLNDKALQLSGTKSLVQLLEEQGISVVGCAVAINNRIVPRNHWQNTALHDGDEISLFQAIAGG